MLVEFYVKITSPADKAKENSERKIPLALSAPPELNMKAAAACEGTLVGFFALVRDGVFAMAGAGVVQVLEVGIKRPSSEHFTLEMGPQPQSTT